MSNDIYGRVEPVNIDMLSKIIEAYEHLGIVSTLDRHQGLVVIRCTEDTREDMLGILDSLPFPINLLEPPA
ncbi:MAG: DUF4911 domain-containing protein [Syntrophomonadaceae bacterium]